MEMLKNTPAIAEMRSDGKPKIAFVLTAVNYYRTPFFEKLKKRLSFDVYEFARDRSNSIKKAHIGQHQLACLVFRGFRIYNFLNVILGGYRVIILSDEKRFLSNYIILLFSKLFGYKTVLWGHGFKVKNYLRESENPPAIRKLSYNLASLVWFYTEKEMAIWKRFYPNLNAVSLNNTLDLSKLEKRKGLSRREAREKHHIFPGIVLIFCARFIPENNRRIDVLLEVIEKLQRSRFSFIIIGDGPSKPDFTKFSNVREFGAVYNDNLKGELFDAADLYIQPGHLGLSCVEALAYGKPVVTLKRSLKTQQCVEYAYIIDAFNGLVCTDADDMINRIGSLTTEQIKLISVNATNYYKENLTMDYMVCTAADSLSTLL
jgi:glycosyltransferase involved in cell wall biosynthesis